MGWVEEMPAFTSSGTDAKIARIIPIKCVIALAGSLIVSSIMIPPDRFAIGFLHS